MLNRSAGERLKTNDVEDIALGLGISRATLYRLIAIYRQTPTVEALQPKQRGRSKGALGLDKARHKLIRQTIRELYLKPQRPTLTHLVGQVHLRFVQHGWPLPDRRTIKARVDEIERRLAARKRKDKRAIKATTPIPGEFKVSRPLEVVQIDHTLVDLIVVHEETREPLVRPWLTLAIDVFTRMITGFYLSMGIPLPDFPSASAFSMAFTTRQLGCRNVRSTPHGRSPVCRKPFTSTMARISEARRSFAVVAMKASISFGARGANRITAVISNGCSAQ